MSPSVPHRKPEQKFHILMHCIHTPCIRLQNNEQLIRRFLWAMWMNANNNQKKGKKIIPCKSLKYIYTSSRSTPDKTTLCDYFQDNPKIKKKKTNPKQPCTIDHYKSRTTQRKWIADINFKHFWLAFPGIPSKTSLSAASYLHETWRWTPLPSHPPEALVT